MTRDDPRHQELIEWLRGENYTATQIEQILAKVEQYDSQTLHESIFDSIDRGEFELGTIIKEALGE